MAHDLRWATPHYDYSVSQPWPLMVAKQVAQYVMPVELLQEVVDVEEASSDLDETIE